MASRVTAILSPTRGPAERAGGGLREYWVEGRVGLANRPLQPFGLVSYFSSEQSTPVGIATAQGRRSVPRGSGGECAGEP